MNILVVAAHPDDEILGCGGAMAKHIKGGDKVKVLILAQGVAARSNEAFELDLKIAELKKSAYQAASVLGVRNIKLFGLPDNRLDTMPILDVIKIIEYEIENFRPSLIYTHHHSDLNIDHRICYEAVITAARPLKGSSVKTILTFETLSSTEWRPVTAGSVFQPNWYIDIEDTLHLKKDAMSCYVEELRQWPHSRSIEGIDALAKYRGMMSGLKYAEAFSLVRHAHES